MVDLAGPGPANSTVDPLIKSIVLFTVDPLIIAEKSIVLFTVDPLITEKKSVVLFYR